MAKLVPDYIKMDRSTMLHAVASKKFRGFLKYLVFAMQDYSKEGVIAEGIEKKGELRVTREMGIHLVQGFLLGKPEIFSLPEVDGKHADLKNNSNDVEAAVKPGGFRGRGRRA